MTGYSAFLGLTWCRLHTICLKWLTKTKDVFHLTTQITFTCIGADRTNGGVKFCILSQSIPWGFSGPSLLQTVQLVLLTKANVKGHIKLMLAGLDWFGRRGARFTERPTWVTEAKGEDGVSEQWSESRISTTGLELADYVCFRGMCGWCVSCDDVWR